MFVDEVIERRQAHMSRAYLIHEVIPREVERLPESDGYIDTLSLISQHGLFTRCSCLSSGTILATCLPEWLWRGITITLLRS